MFRRFSTNFAVLSIILDCLWITVSLILANQARPALSALPIVAPILTPIRVPLPLYPVFPIGWVLILLLFSVYDSRKNFRVTDEMTALTLGSFLASISLAGVLYFTYRGVSRVLFLTFLTFSYLGLVFWRLGMRLLYRLTNGKPEHMRKALIVGDGPVGQELENEIAKQPWLGVSVIGFLDDDAAKRANQPKIIGSLDDVCRIVREHQVDDVVICLPRRAYERVNQFVARLHNLPVKVWVIPDYFRLALHKAVVEEFAGMPMLDLRAPALNEYQRLVKRIFDLVAGSMLTIAALPLMAVIALAIRLDSPGPVIFKQQRVGENGRLFWMYKFRTMVDGADKLLEKVAQRDEKGQLIHKLPNDPRVTRVGRFLRRTSLDELPNFFNVLQGSMSLVGPRPELPALVEKYEPWQHRRFAVPQGITGWWQVNGRSDKPMHLHTEDDIYYVQNYSLLLDIQILIKTAWVVVRGRGAY